MHACVLQILDTCENVAQVFVLDRVLEEDGITGDAYGPYDAEFVAEERERAQRDKVGPPQPLLRSALCCCVPCSQSVP